MWPIAISVLRCHCGIGVAIGYSAGDSASSDFFNLQTLPAMLPPFMNWRSNDVILLCFRIVEWLTVHWAGTTATGKGIGKWILTQ